MEGPEHDCVQERRIERLEEKSDRLDNKIDKIMDILTENKTVLSQIITRLDNKKEADTKRDQDIKEEDQRIDKIEQNHEGMRQQNKIIITMITTLLIGFILFFIEYQFLIRPGI
jgi:uncharacterized coiled-coil protein SlyX